MWFFVFNSEAIQAFGFVGYVYLRFQWYKCVWCLCLNGREYRQGERCPFALNSMSVQKDDENYAEKPFSYQRLRCRKAISSFSIC